MARKDRQNSSRGGVLFGLLLGLLLGLGIAVGVALFVTKAPVPFLDKASRAPKTPLANAREAPDPNQGLAGRSVTPTEPAAPSEAARANMTQDIDQLIASLAQGQRAAGSTPTPPAAPPLTPNAQTAYYLQAGAFRSSAEAEALKARILMLGLNGFVQPVQSNGETLHRVRVGPFLGIDEMNQSRTTLGRSSIPVSVVRP